MTYSNVKKFKYFIAFLKNLRFCVCLSMVELGVVLTNICGIISSQTKIPTAPLLMGPKEEQTVSFFFFIAPLHVCLNIIRW